MSKRVVVTGAGGYIGQHVVKELCDRDVDVIAVDLQTADVDQRATFIAYDIFSGSDDIFSELGSPDVCLHLAWKDGFVHNSDSHIEFLSSHYKFVKNMIDGGLSHFAAMGTMHEIGYYEGIVCDDTPCNPISKYGIAKDALRRSLDILTKERAVVFQWLRAFYIYGDDERNNSIFSKILKAEKKGEKSFPFTTGRNQYDFIDIEMLSKQITQAVLQDNITGIINCCSGKPESLKEKTEQYLNDKGFLIKLKYGAYPDRPYDSPLIYGDNTKIKAICKDLF